jgi:hypothetical protein
MSIYNTSIQQFYTSNSYLEEAYNEVDSNNGDGSTYYTNH